ncbi:MAG: CRISPR-associated endonuclease Cas2 [bacterium]|jgi:CRISPR-associated protein Cas2
MPGERTHYIVAYDISSDAKRTKVASILEDYGARRQYSVFEVSLSDAEYAAMRERLSEIADEDANAIVCWMICRDCLAKTDIIAKPSDKPPEEVDPDVLVF